LGQAGARITALVEWATAHPQLDASYVSGTRSWHRVGQKVLSIEHPALVTRVTDVVGLYLTPPQNAVALRVEEKSQIQALDRTAPILPLQPRLAERRSHDYVRHGTITLFAALEIATGQVTAAFKPRHRNTEFVAFLKQIASAYPDVKLSPVIDNYAAPNTPRSPPG
jgi:hypothetical protein